MGLFKAIRDHYELKEYRKQEYNRFEGNDWDRDHAKEEKEWEEELYGFSLIKDSDK